MLFTNAHRGCTFQAFYACWHNALVQQAMRPQPVAPLQRVPAARMHVIRPAATLMESHMRLIVTFRSVTKQCKFCWKPTSEDTDRAQGRCSQASSCKQVASLH